MKKNELRTWALRNHSPDEWWIQVDGEVSDTIVSLDEAFRRAEGSEDSYIIHAAHAEENDDPHWIKMGGGDGGKDAFDVPKWVCAHCRFTCEKRRKPGFSALEAAGYLLIVPGILMTRKRKKPSSAKCPHCGSSKMVDARSKAGQVLLKR